MSARVGEAGRPGRGAPEARQEARGFGDYLEAARKAAGERAAAGAARRAAGVGEVPEEAGASAGAALSRRRTQTDDRDDGLALRRRRLDVAERAGLQVRVDAAPSGGGPAPGPVERDAAASAAPAIGAAGLAAAVEKLALSVERRDRALGPELRMDLGGLLSVRLAHGEKGIEVVFAGDGRAARLAEAELPAVLARLRERGISVWRAEVRVEGEAASAARAAGPDRAAAPGPGAR